MALEPFDADLHHVGLGEVDGTLYGFLVEPGYREVLQNSPRVTNYGSSEDFAGNVPRNLSRWTMDDFSGGAYFYQFTSRDTAVFADSENFVLTPQAYSLRSVPPFVFWEDEAVTTYYNTLAYGGNIYLVTNEDIVRFALSNKTRTAFATTSIKGKGELEMVQLGFPVLWIPIEGASDGFKRYKLSDMSALTLYTYPTGSDVDANTRHGMNFDGAVSVFSFNGKVFTAALSTTDATQPSWAQISSTRLPGDWIDSQLFNGFVYILCADANYRTWLSVFDGDSVQTVLDFPYNFRGRCLHAHGGKLMVGGDSIDFGASDVYVELYEVTGNSLRQTKTFAPENRVSGSSVPRGLKSMASYEGLLWLGCSNGCLIAYETQTDGFFGASTMPDADNLAVEEVFQAREQLFLFARHGSDANLTGFYRLPVAGDTVPSHSAVFTTADFQPEPALNKRWSQIHLLSRYGDLNEPTVEYSIDGGETWDSAVVSHQLDGVVRRSVADLSGATVSRQLRFRVTFPRGTDGDTFTELLGFTLTFSFLETGKRSWVFTVNAYEVVNSTEDNAQPRILTQDVSAIHDQLWAWTRGQENLVFTDLDGETYNVQVTSLNGYQPQIAPRVDGSSREGFYSLVLTEV